MDIHGKDIKSWTKLHETVDIGDNTLTLQEVVDWEVRQDQHRHPPNTRKNHTKSASAALEHQLHSK